MSNDNIRFGAKNKRNGHSILSLSGDMTSLYNHTFRAWIAASYSALSFFSRLWRSWSTWASRTCNKITFSNSLF